MSRRFVIALIAATTIALSLVETWMPCAVATAKAADEADEALSQAHIEEAERTLTNTASADKKTLKKLTAAFMKDIDRGVAARKYAFAAQMGSLAETAAYSSADPALRTRVGAKLSRVAAHAAGRFENDVDPRRHWIPVFNVNAGDVVIVRAQGRWNLWPDGPKEDWLTTADGGRFPGGKNCSASNAPMGSLVGRLSGETMLLGSKKLLRISSPGSLEIAANDVVDDRRNDNNGRIRVTILRFADQ